MTRYGAPSILVLMIGTLGALPACAVFHPARLLRKAPACAPTRDRAAERVSGRVLRDVPFRVTTPAGWLLKLRPTENGWAIEVATPGRADENLARLTPPFHFVPNPLDLDGWHFRNAANTISNDGSMNAPGALREFIFSPAVGQTIEYNGSATTLSAIDSIEAFGRGWLSIESYALTPPRAGERASFESLAFSGCLTWPVGTDPSAGEETLTPRGATGTELHVARCMVPVRGSVSDVQTGAKVPAVNVGVWPAGVGQENMRTTTTDSGMYQLTVTVDDTVTAFPLRATRLGYTGLTAEVKKPAAGWDSVTVRFLLSASAVGLGFTDPMFQPRSSALVLIGTPRGRPYVIECR